jgi:Amidase
MNWKRREYFEIIKRHKSNEFKRINIAKVIGALFLLGFIFEISSMLTEKEKVAKEVYSSLTEENYISWLKDHIERMDNKLDEGAEIEAVLLETRDRSVLNNEYRTYFKELGALIEQAQNKEIPEHDNDKEIHMYYLEAMRSFKTSNT